MHGKLVTQIHNNKDKKVWKIFTSLYLLGMYTMSENVDFTSRCSCGPKEHSNAILMWVIALSSDSIYKTIKLSIEVQKNMAMQY